MNAKNIRELNSDIELTTAIQLLAKTYEELAVMQMQKIRDSVENARRYTDELTKIYGEVKFSYKKQLMKLNKSTLLEDDGNFTFSTANKNGRKLAVLITPNQKFSGNIAQRVFMPFFDYINSVDCDVAVVGKVGKDLLEKVGGNIGFVYINLSNSNDYGSLKEVFEYMLKYESIEVFHGKFVNLIKQEAVKQNLTGDEIKIADYDVAKSQEYIFEPSAEKILTFFEEQIFGTLFKQALSEAKLARLGSRISAMEMATNNAKTAVGALSMERRKYLKRSDNKKQLQRIAGISIWTN